MIDETIKFQIEDELSRMEREENILILYACESGSRAWGFPSSDSDYDVRFIYIRDRDWYLKVDYESQRDVVERPITDILDISGWDLKKSLKLLYKSNPPLIEWINSPIVYQSARNIHNQLKELADFYYSPRSCFYHYGHMAKSNIRQYLQGDHVRIKKYFYVLRPILAMKWIEQGRGSVPMKFSELVNALIDDGPFRQDIDKLLDQKIKGFETDYQPRIDSISDYITLEMETLGTKESSLDKPINDFTKLNDFFLSILLNT